MQDVRRAEIGSTWRWQVGSSGAAYVSSINDGAWVALACSSPADERGIFLSYGKKNNNVEKKKSSGTKTKSLEKKYRIEK